MRANKGIVMANTSVVYARINSDIKKGGEAVLEELGISPSSAIQMFYRQLMTDRALPFTPRAAAHRPLFLDEITGNRLAEELEKGSESIRHGDVLSADEVDGILAEEFGV